MNNPAVSTARARFCRFDRQHELQWRISITQITNHKIMKKVWCVLLVLLLFGAGAAAQPALQTLVTNELSEPYGVAVDTKNNYYITDSVNNRVLKYNPNAGSVTNLAGVLGEAGTDDGPGAFARFNSPQGIVFARGGLVIADSGNHRIRFVALNGTVTTLAGSTAGANDGAGTAAQFNAPAGLAADDAGNIFVADLLNNRVRRIDTANNVTTLASGFSRPTSVTFDRAGNLLYVADTGTHSIRLIRPDGSVELFAGSGSAFISGSKDSLIATSALFNAPRGLLWVGGSTGLLVSDTGNHCVRRVSFNTNYNAFATETYVKSTLISPVGLAIDNNGNFPVVDLAAGQLLNIQVTAPQAPVLNPKIGIVVLTTNFFGDLVTELIPIVNATYNNDIQVAILAEEGTETFYTLDPSADFPEDPLSRNTPARYVNGLLEWTNSIVIPNVDGSNVLVRAISTQDGRRPSEVVSARFQFKVANPIINGKNPGNFTLAINTEDAQIWYTTDGTSPTNRAPSRLYLPGSHLNVVNGTNNVLFTARAFKAGYTPSAEISKTFLFTDLETSVIGVTRDFQAGVGSTIVVPVEVRVAGADALRSLQFRAEVTANGGAPPISAQFRSLSFSTNDFIFVPAPSTNPPTAEVYANGNVTGLAIAYVGQSSGLELQETATAALLAVPIPPTAVSGQTYTISIVQPSGTSDAGQTPVPLSTLASRVITVTNVSYVVGDSGVASWYNAGDFGDFNLGNNDVNNAFHVSLGLYNLFPFTDVFDAMDAFPPDSVTTVGGDGQIRFLDWQLVLRRSLRLSTPNWQRSWSADGLRVPASATLSGSPDLPGETLVAPPPGAVWVRQASFRAEPIENVRPGQAVKVPVYIQVEEGASISGLQFLAKIVPSSSAPSLSAQALFVPEVAASGRPVDGLGLSQVAYAWDLGSFTPPLQGRALLGHVVFTIPATARSGQSYQLRFGNADGAPDENTQYDFETFAGRVWVNGPATGAEDAISDEWKKAFFGSIDCPEAMPGADPDEDGLSNWKEYLAGTDPADSDSHLHLRTPLQTSKNGRRQLALRWLSAPGKSYVLESATDVIHGPWAVVTSGVRGDGFMKEFLAATSAQGVRYYRVRLQD
jgi:sugar lactone lactonase YvrE